MKTIKDMPMLTQDGVKIKEGMKMYKVIERGLSGYSYADIKTGSGELSTRIDTYEVIFVNQGSNARTYTIRKNDGHEITFTAKEDNGGDYFGKRSSAIKCCKKADASDMQKMRVKISDWDARLKQWRKAFVLVDKASKARK